MVRLMVLQVGEEVIKEAKSPAIRPELYELVGSH